MPLGEVDLPDWRVWEKKLCLKDPALPPLRARSGPEPGQYSKKTIISICAQKPHAASGYCNGQCNLRGCQLPSCVPAWRPPGWRVPTSESLWLLGGHFSLLETSSHHPEVCLLLISHFSMLAMPSGPPLPMTALPVLPTGSERTL